MNKIIAKIEDLELSTREYFLFGVVLLLAGLLVGIIVSPKGERTIGSNNGNNNGNNNSGCLTDESNALSDEGNNSDL